MPAGVVAGAASRVDNGSLGAFFDRLFERLDTTPDDRLHVADLSLGGASFKLRCSNREVLKQYSDRLAPSGAATAPGGRIDIIAAADMGWTAGQWAEPDWKMHHYDESAALGGYLATYPYFDRQWIVRQRRSGNAAYFLDRMEDLLPWDSGAPVRVPLNWALHTAKRRMVHAGSLGVDGHGVLIAGPGGAGKSGTTLAGLAGGLQTVGDDYVLLDQHEHPTVSPLYRLLKQDAAGIARIPGLGDRLGALTPNWQGKFEFDPDIAFPGCVAGPLRLGAILLPAVAMQARSTLERVPRAEAVRYLVDALFGEFQSRSAEDLLFLTGLSMRLPIYRMRLSADPAEIAATVRTVIGDHSS
ncbi:hypothetical protein OSH10_10155 [Kaistia defluvii]|uniref:hypothetical protein n=1 Tax=Kaistia defluvii TaxID=410841 RepID=UPI002259958F|nr:hypothetical protein [Kaistia defluvii]MCX5518799.1 hypothetical protein [Kaistia defluvii]